MKFTKRMPGEALLLESSAINQFNFRQVEKQFISGGGGSAIDGTAGQQTSCCSKSAKKNKARRNASQKQASGCSAAQPPTATNKQICDDGDSITGGAQRNCDERIVKLEARVEQLEKTIEQLMAALKVSSQVQICPQKQVCQRPGPAAAAKKPAAAEKPAAAAGGDDDDDVDLFGSDDDEDANELREKRLAEYAAKKTKKPAVVAKSSVVLDVKPWDDETDMAALETAVRSVEMDGLIWGASKLVPLAYGIKKLQIVCVIEDDKVSVEELSEKIEAFEDYVQSVDVAAFNKI